MRFRQVDKHLFEKDKRRVIPPRRNTGGAIADPIINVDKQVVSVSDPASIAQITGSHHTTDFAITGGYNSMV